MGLINSALTAARLYLMRRRQFDNLELRRYFREAYGIDVGLYSYGCFDRWRMSGPMTVGRYCSIAATARSALNNHPVDALTTHPILYGQSFGVIDSDHTWDGALTIEDDVWIGHNAVILAGCRRIGRGAIIGAGSIVTRDVEAYSIVAGNPARKLRDRFPPDLVAAIEASRWWEMSLEELRRVFKSRPDILYRPTEEGLRSLSSNGRSADPQ